MCSCDCISAAVIVAYEAEIVLRGAVLVADVSATNACATETVVSVAVIVACRLLQPGVPVLVACVVMLACVDILVADLAVTVARVAVIVAVVPILVSCSYNCSFRSCHCSSLLSGVSVSTAGVAYV